jgi:hypothetical protein
MSKAVATDYEDDDFPPEEEVIEEVRSHLAKLLPGLAVEEATLTVTLADGTEKSWVVLP